jgi:hypothetical protein
MKEKLIFLIVVFGILFGLLYFISKNRVEKERTKIEENILPSQKPLTNDHIPNNNKKDFQENSISQGDKKNINTLSGQEDLSSYINSSITNSGNDFDVSVNIIEGNGNIATTLSRSIADIFTRSGKNGSSGLLKSSFVHNSAYKKLFDGNSEIIEKLRLKIYTDYLAIGKVEYSNRKGTLVDGTFICTATISMNIISINSKTIAKSFSYSVNGNGVSETQAQEDATQKLLYKFKNEYSSI